MNLSDPPARDTRIPAPRPGGPLWAAYEIGAMVVGLGLFALLCLGSVPLFSLLYVVLPARRRVPMVRLLISRGFRAYLAALRGLCGVRCEAAELAVLRAEGPLIIVANHPSLLDAVVLIAALPNASCIMKAAVLGNPLYAIAARLAGYISNGDPQDMLARSRRELAGGSHFIFFPEGGRSRSFPVSPLSSSCILLARLTHTPLQTVLLDYSSPYLGKHWGLLNRPALPLQIRARLGVRLAPEALGPDARAVLEAYFRAHVRVGRP